MRIGVPRETQPGERRVALVPDVVARLAGSGFEVLVERGAGAAASFQDAEYETAGAMLTEDAFDAEAGVQPKRGGLAAGGR